MWRYVAGGIAALALVAAGWLLFNGQAHPDPVLPSAPAGPLSSAQALADGVVAPTAEALPSAPERSREQKRFDRYDKDRDAKITRAEYLAPRQKAFAKLDTNGDGRLSFDEWAVKIENKFAGADRDRSGALTAAEFATTAVKRKAKPGCVCPQAAAASREED